MPERPMNINVNVSQSQNRGRVQDDGTGCVGCLLVLCALALVVMIARGFQANPVLWGAVSVVVLALGGLALWWRGSARRRAAAAEEAIEATARKAVEVRADIASRAMVDATGGCGWCGHPEFHRAPDGRPVHPRFWHESEVEGAIEAALGVAYVPPPPPDALDSSSRRPRRLPAERAAADRYDIEAMAGYDSIGGCGWCGHPKGHRSSDGDVADPLQWHRLDVENAVQAATGRVDAPQPSGRPAVDPPRQHRRPTPEPDAEPTVALPAITPDAPTDDLQAQLRYTDSGECLWCGSPTPHRTPAGRVIHPARIHKAEYEHERSLRARRGGDG